MIHKQSWHLHQNVLLGVNLNEECHKTTYNSQIGSRHIDMFAEEDQLLIKLRSGIDQPLTDICNHHEKHFLVKCYIPIQVLQPTFGA